MRRDTAINNILTISINHASFLSNVESMVSLSPHKYTIDLSNVKRSVQRL